MRFAAEMIVPGRVEDDFSTPVTPSITLLRHELHVAYEAPSSVRLTQ